MFESRSSLLLFLPGLFLYRAPWMKSIWMFGSSYIIPNVDNVVVGGTTQKDNWSTAVSIEDTNTILSRVSELFPAVAQAPIVRLISFFYAFLN
jgi:glycine/D-amino acid oxidase-like deaminating enzyme